VGCVPGVSALSRSKAGPAVGCLLVVSGGDDSMVRLLDVGGGAASYAPLVGHAGRVTSVAMGPDCRVVVANAVRLWDGG
jgi:hypothetical protein